MFFRKYKGVVKSKGAKEESHEAGGRVLLRVEEPSCSPKTFGTRPKIFCIIGMEQQLSRMRSGATPRVLEKYAWPNLPEHKVQYTKHPLPRNGKRPDTMNSTCINNN